MTTPAAPPGLDDPSREPIPEPAVIVADHTGDLGGTEAEARAHDIAEEWWALYRSDVRGRLGSMTRDHGLADDLTVETFVRLLRHLRAGRDVPTSPAAWLRVTARRLLIDHMRLSAVRAEEPRADLPATHYLSDFDAVERREDAHSRLDILDARQRKVMELRDFHDLSTEEVARIMDMTEQAVRSVRHKAMAKLRAHNVLIREATEAELAEEATA